MQENMKSLAHLNAHFLVSCHIQLYICHQNAGKKKFLQDCNFSIRKQVLFYVISVCEGNCSSYRTHVWKVPKLSFIYTNHTNYSKFPELSSPFPEINCVCKSVHFIRGPTHTIWEKVSRGCVMVTWRIAPLHFILSQSQDT